MSLCSSNRWGGLLDKAPFDRIEGSQIAALMGKKMPAWKDQWVQAVAWASAGAERSTGTASKEQCGSIPGI